jgi:hypothetical protein
MNFNAGVNLPPGRQPLIDRPLELGNLNRAEKLRQDTCRFLGNGKEVSTGINLLINKRGTAAVPVRAS